MIKSTVKSIIRRERWPIILRHFLLMPFPCKWNAKVRDTTAKF